MKRYLVFVYDLYCPAEWGEVHGEDPEPAS
jgi:hypothetical protein